MAAAPDALQDPFAPASEAAGPQHSPPRDSSLRTATQSLHRPTFTQILSTADLDRARDSSRDAYADGGGDDEEAIDLPVAPPLSHSLLSDPDFSPSDFLLARRHTPLDELRAELREYLASLRQSLVGVINDEYEAFIGLSLGLKHAHVAQSLARVRKPVLEIRAQVVRVQEDLLEMRDEMQEVLGHRKEAREHKALLRKLLATEECVDKVEALLNLRALEPEPTKSRPTKPRRSTTFTSMSDSPTKRLERIANEYIHMQYLVDRAGPDLPFIRSLQPRVDKITQALRGELSDLLSSILAARPRASGASMSAPAYRQDLTTTLRTFLSLGMVCEAEEIVRKELVRPFVGRTVTRDALAAAAGQSRQGSAPTSPLSPVARPTSGADSTQPTAPEPGPQINDSTVPSPYRLDLLPAPASSLPKDGTNLAPLVEVYNRILAFVANECGTLLDVAERVLEVRGQRARSLIGAVTAEGNGRNGGLGGVGKRKRLAMGPKGAGGVDGAEEAGSLADEPESHEGESPSTAQSGREEVPGFQMLNRVVVDEVLKAVMNELGGVVFAAGRPTVFHQHYRLTTDFLSRLEALSPTLSRLEALRAHPTLIAFQKRFQLAVYFQLRLKEAVTQVERAFEMGSASGGGARDVGVASGASAAAGRGAPGGKEGDGFVMSESEAVWRALERSWEDEVWLAELSGRFWRLTLQILSRYRTWLNDKVPRYVLPSSGSSVNLAADGDRDRGGRFSPNPPTPRPSTPGNLEADGASEETTLRQLTVLIADARTMERRARRLFQERIRERLPEPDSGAIALEEAEDGEAAAFEEALASMTSFVPSLSSQIGTILVKRCSEHLKLVRSVASQVRASTRKGPSEPSYFVHNILKELKAYLSGPGRVVEEELRRKWATAVVEDIAARYTTILSTQKKTEDSLRWLKKGRQGLSFFGRAVGGGGGSGAGGEEGGEDDRVKMQMQLDVETLAQDAVALEVAVEESEAFLALKRAAKGDVPKEEEGRK